MCANNYLGLGDNQRLIDAAKRTYDERGYGVASVRFICGTQDIHKQLEAKISGFLGTDDTILYSSCFDANGGLFETILTADDAVISDELNHASIIDGVRLCKAKRFRYKNNNMEDLEAKLKEADEAGARIKLIATDGVFSMDGIICNLKGVCDLADKYNALVMVDDSHAVGFVGAHGRGTAEHCGVEGRVDIITGTLGKALGGASGGYTSGRKEIIDLLRQRSRPYLFSNSLAPAIAGASIEMFNMLEESTELRDHLEETTAYYRKQLVDNGFDIIMGTHPCVPVMLYDEVTAAEFAERMRAKGICCCILLSGSSEGKSKNPYTGMCKPYKRRYRLHCKMLHRSKRRNGIEQINIAYAMINYYKEKASTIKSGCLLCYCFCLKWKNGQ